LLLNKGNGKAVPAFRVRCLEMCIAEKKRKRRKKSRESPE
jgi:hypothetical protein